MNKNLKSQRNSSIELLRIISMLFIVVSHYSIHGNIKTFGMNFGFNKLLIDTTQLGGLGVAVFVMITGYFMYNKEFKISRVINVILTTLFYSLVIYFSVAFATGSEIGLKFILKTIFPILTSHTGLLLLM